MKKALLIGINYKGTENELNGCLNDVANVNTMLITQFNYSSSNITILTDDTPVKPTRDNILSALNNVCTSSVEGDEIWIHYSGHGSYVRDTNGDETDGNDEAIVPLDFQENGFIIDDVIKATFSKLHPKSRCVVVFDSCHSGTCSDLPYCYNSVMSTQTDKVNKVQADVIMISGCRDNQTSADANIGNKWTGAITYFLTKVLSANKYAIQLGNLVNGIRTELKNNGYAQYPVLTSSRPINLQKFFCLNGDSKPYVA